MLARAAVFFPRSCCADFITVTIPKLDIGDVCGGGSGGDAATTVLKVYGEDGKAFTSRTLYVDQKASEFGDGSDGDYEVKGKTYVDTQDRARRSLKGSHA